MRWVVGFFLVLLAVSVFAVVPTVDFNFSPLNNRVNTSVLFNPNVVSATDINVIMWQFGGDGNVNYFNSPTEGSFSDTFTGVNGTDINVYKSDYNRTRTSTSTTMKLNNNAFELIATNNGVSGGDTFRLNNRDLNIWDTNKTLEFSLKGITVTAGTLDTTRFGLGKSSDNTTPVLYLNFSTVTDLTCVGGGGGATTFLANDTFKFVMQKTGTNTFNVSCFKNGTVFSMANTNFGVESFKFMEQLSSAPVGVGIVKTIVDDLNINGTSVFDANNNRDTNQNHVFSTVGNKNVCLTAGNSDGNTTFCKDLNVSGFISLSFFDENNNAAISPTVSVNGSVQTLSSNVLTYDLNGVYSLSNFTVLASDVNRSERKWFFKDLNADSSVSIKALLLDANKGRAISFQFYKPDKVTLLANAVISLRRDFNFSSIVQADSLGRLNFFVNADANYVLDIDANADGLSDYNYTGTIIQVRVPKNETTGALISPFKLNVGGLAVYDFNNLSVASNVKVFSDTQDYYTLTIGYSATSTSFYDRPYAVKTTGGETSYILQPYLLPQTELLSSLKVYDASTGYQLPKIVVLAKTNTVDGSKTLVESGLSDDSGTVLFSFRLNQEYFLYFFDANGLDLTGEKRIVASSTTYYIDIQTSSANISSVGSDQIVVSVHGSNNDRSVLSDANLFYFDENVSVHGSTLRINTIRIRISQDGNYAFDKTYSGYPAGANFYQLIGVGAFPNNYSRFLVDLDINSTDRDSNFTYHQAISGVYDLNQDFVNNFQKAAAGWDSIFFVTVLWLVSIIGFLIFSNAAGSPGIGLGGVVLITALFYYLGSSASLGVGAVSNVTPFIGAFTLSIVVVLGIVAWLGTRPEIG